VNQDGVVSDEDRAGFEEVKAERKGGRNGKKGQGKRDRRADSAKNP